jgi:hypothetical protein
MLSLVWVFVGCAFLCGKNENCGEDVDISIETPAIFDETSHEDSCPIKASAKTTAPERIVLKFDSPAVVEKVSANFSTIEIFPASQKFKPKSYRPPIIISHRKRPLVLRI